MSDYRSYFEGSEAEFTAERAHAAASVLFPHCAWFVTPIGRTIGVAVQFPDETMAKALVPLDRYWPVELVNVAEDLVCAWAVGALR